MITSEFVTLIVIGRLSMFTGCPGCVQLEKYKIVHKNSVCPFFHVAIALEQAALLYSSLGSCAYKSTFTIPGAFHKLCASLRCFLFTLSTVHIFVNIPGVISSGISIVVLFD
jgi:hypothetical protein